jgi:hypothetical protein
MLSGPNPDEQMEAAQTISSKRKKTNILLFWLLITSNRYCCWSI